MSCSGKGKPSATLPGATTHTISHDAIDNVTGRDTTSYSYNYHGQNQLTTGSPTYDNNGNMTLEAGTSYSYDAWNRMVYTSGAYAGATNFVYDT